MESTAAATRSRLLPAGKYVDPGSRAAIGVADACDFDAWTERHRECACAVHPDGYLVFLDPELLDRSDEYASGDPYSVSDNVDSGFHGRRFEITRDLLMRAATTAAPRRVLDIGCGEGHITEDIRLQFPEAEITGLDYSQSAIVTAARLFGDIQFVVADACAPPFADDYFDVVICNNLWEHVPDPLRLLAGIGRIMRSGGHLVISTPSRYRVSNLIRRLTRKPVQLASSLHVTEYSIGQVVEQLRFGGYDAVAVESRSIPPKRWTVKSFVSKRILTPPLRLIFRILGTEHSLESTVFYLARKT